MMLRKGFAAALHYVRKSRELTQEDFSEVSSRTYLSSLERGIKSPTLDKVEELASVLRISPVTLVVLAAMHKDRQNLQQVVGQIEKDLNSLTAGHHAPRKPKFY